MKSVYKRHKSWGPGGIKCSCCCPHGYSIKDTKKYVNRLYRRTFKVDYDELA